MNLDELIAQTAPQPTQKESLKKPEAAGLDLDHLIATSAPEAAASATPSQPSAPTALDSLARGFLQGGTALFGDEIVGALGGDLMRAQMSKLAKGQVRLTPEAEVEAKRLGIEVPGQMQIPSQTEGYRAIRDSDRQANKEADDAHGGFSLVGNLGGGIATSRLLPGFSGVKAAGALGKLGLGAKVAGMAGRTLAGAGTGLAQGGLFGAGASNANDAQGLIDDTKEGAKLGGLFGLGAGVLGEGLGALGSKAGAARESIKDAVRAKKTLEQAALEKAAAGAVGGAVQKGSRFEEQFLRHADNPNLPEELRTAIKDWQASPQSQELVGSVLKNQLAEAPEVAGQIANKRQALQELQEGSAQAIDAATEAAVSPKAAREQIGARLWRYGLPAVAGAIGHHYLGPYGLAGGLAGGAVLRPMLHSFKHLARNPAFKTSALRLGEGVAGNLSSMLGAATRSAGAIETPVAAELFPGLLTARGATADNQDLETQQAIARAMRSYAP